MGEPTYTKWSDVGEMLDHVAKRWECTCNVVIFDAHLKSKQRHQMIVKVEAFVKPFVLTEGWYRSEQRDYPEADRCSVPETISRCLSALREKLEEQPPVNARKPL